VQPEFFGHLSIRLPNGYVQHVVIRENHYARFLGRLYEVLETVFKSGVNPEKVNYKGDYAGAVPTFLKDFERGESHE